MKYATSTRFDITPDTPQELTYLIKLLNLLNIEYDYDSELNVITMFTDEERGTI